MSRTNHDGSPQVAATVLPWPAHRPAQGGDNAIFAVVDALPVEELTPAAALCIQRTADTDDAETRRRLLTMAGAAIKRALDLAEAATEDREPDGGAP